MSSSTLGQLGHTAQRLFLRAWAASALAPGVCYQAINRYGRQRSGSLRTRLFTGTRMWCDLSDEIQRLAYFYGAFEPIESQLLSRLARPGWTAIDVGANVGCYTLLLASLVGDGGRVIAVEPIKKNLEVLRKNLALNDFGAQVSVVASAIGQSSGTLTLHLNQHDAAENSTDYTQNVFGPLVHSEEVTVTTLDALARAENLTAVDFMKLDIEGGELPALRGASEVLRTFRPIVLLEINPPHIAAVGYSRADLLTLLAEYGYEVWRVGNEGMQRLDGEAEVSRENVLAFPLEFEVSKDIARWNSKGVIRRLALKRAYASVKVHLSPSKVPRAARD